jgi:hypothetical protein
MYQSRYLPGNVTNNQCNLQPDCSVLCPQLEHSHKPRHLARLFYAWSCVYLFMAVFQSYFATNVMQEVDRPHPNIPANVYKHVFCQPVSLDICYDIVLP